MLSSLAGPSSGRSAPETRTGRRGGGPLEPIEPLDRAGAEVFPADLAAREPLALDDDNLESGAGQPEPQVMLYGFFGFTPTSAGFQVRPRLPQDWPEATITRVHLHDVVLDLTVKADGTIRVSADRASELPMWPHWTGA